MAHFAQLDESNVVTQVIVVHNNDCLLDGVEDEATGVAFCKSLFGGDTNWKQTSYNGSIRKNYAGVGHTFDPERDAFIAPKPFASWVFDEQTCSWSPPITMPQDGKWYIWNEETISWIEVAE